VELLEVEALNCLRMGELW